MSEKKPTVGCIIIYNHPGSADGKYQPDVSPALVQRVNNDGTVEAVVFSVSGGLFFAHNLLEYRGDYGEKKACKWHWPEAN